MGKKNPKLCVVASAGGHLTEAVKAIEKVTDVEIFFATNRIKGVQERVNNRRVKFITDPGRNIFLYVVNVCESINVFFTEQPDVVFTTGAGIAIPLCYLAKLLGKKIVFLESAGRVNVPSKAARIIYPIADEFVVQSERLLKFFSRAIYGGRLL